MLVNETPYTTIWYNKDKESVSIIDQTLLPHHFDTVELVTLEQFCTAIVDMQVRGAPLIGVTAAYALALALRHDSSRSHQTRVANKLVETRPTAINLRWAVERVIHAIKGLTPAEVPHAALAEAHLIREEDIRTCEAIGAQGMTLLADIYQKTQQTVNILTHCNAGWLATVNWGTALSPIYKAYEQGIPLHIWVDETRPRNQGASLTAWELKQQGIPHTVIADNTGGHLMQHGQVDLCLVGSDRTTARGDVCNKIGTYLKALAAFDNHIPFYVALPISTIDWQMDDGIAEIPIEQRSGSELSHITGLDTQGKLSTIKIIDDSPVANFAFDVTPARLITGLITESGITKTNKVSMSRLRPNQVILNDE